MIQLVSGLVLAAATIAGGPSVLVDGKPFGTAVLLDGVPYFEVTALTSENGLVQARGWKVDGDLLVAGEESRNREGVVVVQRSGVVSRHVRTVDGRAFVPVDDVAHSLGGHVHDDRKSGVLRVSTVRRCDYCVLATKEANTGL